MVPFVPAMRAVRLPYEVLKVRSFFPFHDNDLMLLDAKTSMVVVLELSPSRARVLPAALAPRTRYGPWTSTRALLVSLEL